MGGNKYGAREKRMRERLGGYKGLGRGCGTVPFPEVERLLKRDHRLHHFIDSGDHLRIRLVTTLENHHFN